MQEDTMDRNSDFYPFIAGERIYLREVRPSDVNENYYRWMNDPEVNKYLESRYYPNALENLAEYVQDRLRDKSSTFLAIVLKENHRHVGNIKVGPINWIHRLGDVGVLVGEKDMWGKAYGSEAISLIASYAFNTLNLHKLTAACCDSNIGSAKSFQKAGFTIEGVQRNHAFCGGRYEDVLLLGLVNPKEVR